jgi:VCBS repeat-containing protein
MAKTSIKVATMNGAAKDDLLTSIDADHLSGNLDVLANDPGSAHLYSLTQNLSGLDPSATFPATTSALSAAGATISINADGTIAYDATGVDLQHLADGVGFTDSFTYTVQLANGAYSTAVATVQLLGANDAPTLAPIAAATILDTALDDTPAPITGTLVGADADDGATLTYAISGTSVLGAATLVGADYSFTADADAIDALQLGESATATFTATVTDEHGASASQTMEFTLVGANDTAEFGGVATGAVAEDGTLTTGGVVTVADRDHDQSAYLAAAADALAGDHGDFSFDAASGAWAYSLDNADAAVQGLTSGQSLTDTLTVASIDGSMQDIVVTINGADDAAVFGGAATGSVTEDATLTTGGTLTVSDADDGQSGFQAAADLSGEHGTFTFAELTGAWDYSLNNTDAAVQGLWSGETLTDTLTVAALDGGTADIVVTIHGADDAAVFGGVVTGSVAEDGALTTGGVATVSDLDHDQSAFQAATLAELTGEHGTFTFAESTGLWGYTLNNADAAVQALNTGASLTDTMTVLSFDGSAQDIVVTIGGADEAVLPPTSVDPTPVKHVVNNGLTSVNDHKVITDFVAGDLLQYASNLSHDAPVGYDNDGDGSLESTAVTFTYNTGNNADLQVVLVGYSGAVGFFHEA